MLNSEHFSQGDEETVISEFFKKDKPGTFLDVGAFDGIMMSNTRTLALNGWAGWFVEPSPTVFVNLEKNTRQMTRRVLFNAPCAATPGIRPFFMSGEDVPYGSSCSPAYVAARGRKPLSVHYMSAVSPDEIAQLAFEQRVMFEFVSLDAEGLTLEIMKVSKNLLKHTKLLCYEHLYGPENDFRSICEDLGFRNVLYERFPNTIVAR